MVGSVRMFALLVFFFSVGASAAVEKISFSATAIQTQKAERSGDFTSVVIKGFENSKRVGQPELPVKSFLLAGTPASIKANVEMLGSVRMTNTKPLPVQEQPCRCATERVFKFEYNENAYRASAQAYDMTYIGAFRGQPITRLDVNLAHYDAGTNSTEFFNNVRVSYNTHPFSLERGTYTDYLIIVPANLADGVKDFAAFKKSEGYNVIVEAVQTPQNTLKGIGDIIANHYKNDGTDFVLLVGDEKTIPMFSANTSGSSATPSDLKYFTMDGANDTVPDMFYGRVAAKDIADISARLSKSMEFDQKSYKDNKGILHVLGIASNQGSSPSDDEYITSIEQKLASGFGYQAVHFAQDNSDSNPQHFNNELSAGAAWVFYVGHGSGYSWPSMGNEYSASDISGIANRQTVKPIIVDVACQNGRLMPGYHDEPHFPYR